MKSEAIRSETDRRQRRQQRHSVGQKVQHNYGRYGSAMSLFSPTTSSNNAANCTGLPTLPSSYVPAPYAEPTLVNGKVYVPAYEAFSSGSTILTGGGVLVFGTCQ
jgi:hypothetical protein